MPAAAVSDEASGREGAGTMEGFGPLSELTQDMTPEDRAEIDRIKAEMQREEDRLAAARQAGRRTGPRAGCESAEQPNSAVTGRPAGV